MNWNITLNVGYIEENYPRLAGEYGCDFYYADDSKKDCQQSRFFSGFCDANENFVSVALISDQTSPNEKAFCIYSHCQTKRCMFENGVTEKTRAKIDRQVDKGRSPVERVIA